MSKAPRLEDCAKRPYSVALTALGEADGGGWLAETRELPGCIAVGATREEALRNMEEARLSWLETALDEGLAIPEPRLNRGEYSGRLSLRIPRTLHGLLADLAFDEGVSLNQLICDLLSRGAGYETAHRDGYARADSGITISWADGESLTIPESVLSRSEPQRSADPASVVGSAVGESTGPRSKYRRGKAGGKAGKSEK